jgi:hypothetical protein
LIRPCRAGAWRDRINTHHRTFRHVAGNRRETIKPLVADAIGQRVDQAGNVGLRFFRQRRNHLPWRQRLGERRGEPHDLDAKARIDRFDFVAEQAGQSPHIAHGQSCADPDRFEAVVDPVKKQIEPFRAEALGLTRAPLRSPVG